MLKHLVDVELSIMKPGICILFQHCLEAVEGIVGDGASHPIEIDQWVEVREELLRIVIMVLRIESHCEICQRAHLPVVLQLDSLWSLRATGEVKVEVEECKKFGR